MNDIHNTCFQRIKALAMQDATILEEKDKHYGASWKKRGGVGAYMVTARKWDRIETICEAYGYDIFKAASKTGMEETVLDTIRDLRRYLLLVEEFILYERTAKGIIPDSNIAVQARFPDEEGEPGPGYVDQD